MAPTVESALGCCTFAAGLMCCIPGVLLGSESPAGLVRTLTRLMTWYEIRMSLRLDTGFEADVLCWRPLMTCLLAANK